MKLTKQDGVVGLMALVYVAITFTLQTLKHNAFNTRIFDFARFSNAIWTTLDGTLLYTSISGRSILGDHFSPIMAAYAPVFWLWSDERVLFLIQSLNVAATGLILYHLARTKQPQIAGLIAVLFFLNPAVHELNLFELRRIVFGMPWFALGLYGVAVKNRRLMLAGLAVALLAKESVALYVLMIGLYLMVVERDWRWGTGLVVLGGLWAWLIGDVVIGLFNQNVDVYPQLYYYSEFGDSYGDMVRVALTDPLRIVRTIVGQAQMLALFRVLLPFAFLVFLESRLLVIVLPYLGLMFLSEDVDMYQLDKWYMTTVTPVLFVALIMGWRRLPKRWEKAGMGLTLAATLVAFFVFSYMPLGGRFDGSIYQPTERDRRVAKLLDGVPDDVSIESHPRYVPHLTYLNELHEYRHDSEHLYDYILYDSQVAHFPYEDWQVRDEAMNLLADPDYVLAGEAEGVYLFGGEAQEGVEVGISAETKLTLTHYTLAIQDKNGLYQPLNNAIVRPGDTLRVVVHWQSNSDDIAERTVSLRIAAADGFLLSQHDQIPAAGYRPTSLWRSDTTVRDVYYLTLPEGTAPQSATLDVVLYDTFSLENIPFDGQPTPILTLQSLLIEQP